MAMQAAKDSRDAALLGKPIRRAKKAVEFDAALLKGAEELKTELDEERKEKERLYLPNISPIYFAYISLARRGEEGEGARRARGEAREGAPGEARARAGGARGGHRRAGGRGHRSQGQPRR